MYKKYSAKDRANIANTDNQIHTHGRHITSCSYVRVEFTQPCISYPSSRQLQFLNEMYKRVVSNYSRDLVVCSFVPLSYHRVSICLLLRILLRVAVYASLSIASVSVLVSARVSRKGKFSSAKSKFVDSLIQAGRQASRQQSGR